MDWCTYCFRATESRGLSLDFAAEEVSLSLAERPLAVFLKLPFWDTDDWGLVPTGWLLRDAPDENPSSASLRFTDSSLPFTPSVSINEKRSNQKKQPKPIRTHNKHSSYMNTEMHTDHQNKPSFADSPVFHLPKNSWLSANNLLVKYSIVESDNKLTSDNWTWFALPPHYFYQITFIQIISKTMSINT